jgi:hypothetical protein
MANFPFGIVGRFWEQVDKTSGCWLWTGGKDKDGYGKYRGTGAHRFACELLIGPIPKGMEPDHIKANGCTSNACVKAIADEHGPTHLEVVTRRENILRSDCPSARNARKTHCKRGHPFDAANTYVRPGGTGRGCRTCWGLPLLEVPA